MKSLRRLLIFSKAFFPVLSLTVIFGLFGFLSAHGITIIAALFIMKFLGLSVYLTYEILIVLMVLCGVLRGILRYAEHLTGHYTAFKMLADIRTKIFEKLQVLAPARLEDKEKGDLISLVTSDIETLEIFYAHTIAPITIFILHSLIMFALFSIFTSWLIGLIALLAYLTIGLIIPLTKGKKTKTHAAKYRQNYSAFSGHFMDQVSGSNDLLALGQSAFSARDLANENETLEGINKKFRFAVAGLRSTTDLTIYSFIIIGLFTTLLLFTNNYLNEGQTILSLVLLIGSFGPSTALSALPGTLSHTLAAGERILGLLDESPAVTPVNDGQNFKYTDVRLKDINFAYEQELVLENINYTFRPKTIYGIHAVSGSGKSTLLKLLMRFWDAKDGSITYGDLEIKDLNTASLHANISYMTQDTYIFNMSLRENITLGANYHEDAIKAALKSAHLEPFISSLTAGLDTQAGELGSRLSGGEKQRIGLARMFLHDGDLVLLDEPTSNVDALSEAAILEAIATLKQKKTVIMVSHRPSTLRVCDVILTFKDGKLLEVDK